MDFVYIYSEEASEYRKLDNHVRLQPNYIYTVGHKCLHSQV